MNKRKRKEPVTPKRNNYYIYLILLAVIPLILNWKNIKYDFTSFDDTVIITNNYSFLKDFGNIFKAFERDTFFHESGKTNYQPVQNVSFMIDARISGEKPTAYHFSNILLHILTVIVLFFLLRKSGIRDNISFYVALLFSVHPLFTAAIAWVPGRGDLLAGLFVSLSLLSFIYYNSNKNRWFFVLHAATFLLALFSKEISVFLPITLIAYYWFILKKKYDIRELLRFIILWGLSVFVFFLLRHLFLNPQSTFSFGAFISNLQMIPILLSKLIVPYGLSGMPIYDITFTISGIIVFIALAIYVWKLKSADKPIIIFGIGWFIWFLIPSMYAALPFAKVHYQYLEPRGYLPSIGIFIALGVILNGIINEKRISQLAGFMITVTAIFSFISYNYSEDFADGVIFFTSLIKSNPENAFAYGERGRVYLSKKEADLALDDFDHSIRISPNNPMAYFHKGVLYNSGNDRVKAEQFFATALNYDTLYPENNILNASVYFNLSSIELNLKKYEEAIFLLNKGLIKYPGTANLCNNLGLAYYYSGKYDSALIEYSNAIRAEQTVPSYYNNRGLVENHLNDYNNAIKDFNSALALNPNYFLAWGNRGRAKINMKDYEGAISDLNMAIRLRRDFATLWYFRGLAYYNLNRQAEANADWTEAKRLGYAGPGSEGQK